MTPCLILILYIIIEQQYIQLYNIFIVVQFSSIKFEKLKENLQLFQLSKIF